MTVIYVINPCLVNFIPLSVAVYNGCYDSVKLEFVVLLVLTFFIHKRKFYALINNEFIPDNFFMNIVLT